MNFFIKPFSLLIMATLSMTACQPSGNQDSPSKSNHTDQDWTGDVIADPIIYEVLVKNPDPDDEWASEKIKKLKANEFINTLFDAVYEGRATPYNYHTGEVMSIEDIRQLESSEDFDRSLIGKIQFDETWYFDPTSMIMKKDVKSVLLAYEVYDHFEDVVGYKAAFLIRLNE